LVRNVEFLRIPGAGRCSVKPEASRWFKSTCKIRGFHDGDYEGCRLLGYRNLIHTSQETRYVSATEPNRLMLCKIWSFHDGDYEEIVFWDVALVTANVILSPRIPSILKMEAICSSETSVLTRSTRSYIPEAGIFSVCVFTGNICKAQFIIVVPLWLGLSVGIFSQLDRLTVCIYSSVIFTVLALSRASSLLLYIKLPNIQVDFTWKSIQWLSCLQPGLSKEKT
jgi:hypothetical protein